MDDLKTHEGEGEDTQGDDSQDTQNDDLGTSNDTDDEGDRKGKQTAEEAKEAQKTAWLKNIKSGKKSIDDMPANLKWLREEIEPELVVKQAPVKKVEEDEVTLRVRQELAREKEKEEKALIVSYLEEGSLTDEQMESVRDEFQSLKADGLSDLKALKAALKLSGIKNIAVIIEEKRKEGMQFAPTGSQSRRIIKKNDGITDMERKFMTNLPPGFKL